MGRAVRVRVKICGITRQQDAIAAAAAGADAIGLNFHPGSRRFVTAEQAESIAQATPPFVALVGLFVDLPAAEVSQILARVPLSMLQFQGEESAAHCESFGRPYIKSVNVSGPVDVPGLHRRYPKASGFLLDASVPGMVGGTGQTFDWSLWPTDAAGSHLVLAGGLTPANVGEAIRLTRPYAVDICSGVEQAPGIKDRALMEQFIKEVERADSGE